MKKLLITGAAGQIGSELTVALRRRYSDSNVIACGHKTKPDAEFLDTGPFTYLDIRDFSALMDIVKKHNVDTIFHLAGILSAVGEKNPPLVWDIITLTWRIWK
jgi:nucleoside-diphosphate-sugar epimerase